MNNTERDWLTEVSEAERGVPVIAGAGRSRADERARIGAPLRFVPVTLVALTCGVCVLALDYTLRTLAESTLAPEWSGHWITTGAAHVLACLTAPLVALAALKVLHRTPENALAPPSKSG